MWAEDPRSSPKSSLRILTNTLSISSRIKIPKNETFANIHFLWKSYILSGPYYFGLEIWHKFKIDVGYRE